MVAVSLGTSECSEEAALLAHIIQRQSYMSVHVLLKILNKLWKSDKV